MKPFPIDSLHLAPNSPAYLRRRRSHFPTPCIQEAMVQQVVTYQLVCWPRHFRLYVTRPFECLTPHYHPLDLACLERARLGFAANSECELPRSVSSNRASPASKRLNLFSSTRDIGEVIFAIPVGFFELKSDVDLNATAFSTAEVFSSL
jgi:hypothetical protein